MDRYKKENEQLKARRLFTRSKTTDKEKAKIVDILDNSIDVFLSNSKDKLKVEQLN